MHRVARLASSASRVMNAARWRSNSSGLSRLSMWPTPGRTCSSAFGIAACIARIICGGTRRSCSPHSSRTRARIDGSTAVRSKSTAALTAFEYESARSAPMLAHTDSLAASHACGPRSASASAGAMSANERPFWTGVRRSRTNSSRCSGDNALPKLGKEAAMVNDEIRSGKRWAKSIRMRPPIDSPTRLARATSSWSSSRQRSELTSAKSKAPS